MRLIAHQRAWSARRCAHIAAAIATAGLLLPEAADAQRPRRAGEAERVPTRAESAKRAEKPAPAPTPLLAVISLRDQKVSIYDSNGQILRSSVSTGTPGHPTPTGIFSVIQKNRFHVSNIYSGAPMPFMQRITWSGIALHAGHLPGYPASHGCIRLPYDVASRLFGMTKLGMRVVVSPTDTGAVGFSSAALPAPIMKPADLDTAGAAGEPAARVQLAAAEAAEDAARQSDGPGSGANARRALNPHQRAVIARTRSRDAAVASVKAAKAALDESQRASVEANQAIGELRAAEGELGRADAAVQKARVSVDNAASDEVRDRARAALAEAERRLEAATRQASEAKAREAVKSSAAFAAAVASRDADKASEAAAEAQRAAERGVEPVSIFVSRKEKRLYVRQGFTPVFDAPITIRDADAPIGTHLYVAMEARDQAGALSWMSVTVPTSGYTGERERAPVKRGAAPPVPAALPLPPSNAARALERLEIPAEVMERVSDRLWVGASLVVSDFGVSNETGRGTDFIILTR